MSQTITTKKLGELLHHWHESPTDPVSVIGSMLIAGKPVDEGQVKKTREKIRKLLKSAEHGSHGWGQKEVEELKTISDGLSGLLRVYRFGEMPTLADFRTHLTNGKDAQGRRYISAGKPILHFDMKGETGRQALVAAKKADENRALAGKGRADMPATQKGDMVYLAVNNIESLYDWIFALTQSGPLASNLARTIMEDLGYSWVGQSNPAAGWKKSSEDNWKLDVIDVRRDGPFTYVGQRKLEGTTYNVWQVPQGIYVAQLAKNKEPISSYAYVWNSHGRKNPAKTMSIREAQKERARGAAWFHGLRREQKFDLGDAFVLDTFDWRDWMDDKPTAAFLNGADEARMNWEI